MNTEIEKLKKQIDILAYELGKQNTRTEMLEIAVNDLKAKQDIININSIESKENKVLNKNINEVGFSIRVLHCLKSINDKIDEKAPKDLIELSKFSEQELLIMTNFGRKSLNEVKKVLCENGLHLEFRENIRWNKQK